MHLPPSTIPGRSAHLTASPDPQTNDRLEQASDEPSRCAVDTIALGLGDHNRGRAVQWPPGDGGGNNSAPLMGPPVDTPSRVAGAQHCVSIKEAAADY